MQKRNEPCEWALAQQQVNKPPQRVHCGSAQETVLIPANIPLSVLTVILYIDHRAPLWQTSCFFKKKQLCTATQARRNFAIKAQIVSGNPKGRQQGWGREAGIWLLPRESQFGALSTRPTSPPQQDLTSFNGSYREFCLTYRRISMAPLQMASSGW